MKRRERCAHCGQLIKIVKRPDSVERGKRLIEWRKANGKLNMGRPPRHDWDKVVLRVGDFTTVKNFARYYEISEKRAYEVLRQRDALRKLGTNAIR